MGGLTMILAGAAVVVMVAWLFGDGPARFVGIVLMVDGLGGIAIHGSLADSRFGWEAAGGFALWLIGHWLFAAKFGVWRSRVGRAVWGIPVLRWLSPA